jgi:hypothetical protein
MIIELQEQLKKTQEQNNNLKQKLKNAVSQSEIEK